MRNKMFACLVATLLLASGALTVHAEEYSGIAWHMDMYGGALSDTVLEWITTSYVPETVDYGDISVTFNEVLCDGRWLYTSVEAVPNDPDAVLLFPSSAWLDDRVSGGYGEELRDDDRTFIDAAVEDGKRLVMVSVYPALFDSLPEYFKDHLQLADDKSFLLSGGMVSWDGDVLETNWKVRIYDIDPQTGERIDDAIIEALHPLEAPVYTPMEQQDYNVVDTSGDLSFETMTLIRTPLTTYTEVSWIDEEDYYIYDYTLLDADGQEYPEGASSEAYAFEMDALPDTLTLVLTNNENEQAQTVLLNAVR